LIDGRYGYFFKILCIAPQRGVLPRLLAASEKVLLIARCPINKGRPHLLLALGLFCAEILITVYLYSIKNFHAYPALTSWPVLAHSQA
jgi:hypothetical protein